MHLHLPTSGKLYMDKKANGVVLVTALQTRGYLQPTEEELWLKEIRVEGLPMQVRVEDGGRHYFGHHRVASQYVAEVIMNSETLYGILAQDHRKEERRNIVEGHIKKSLQHAEEEICDLFEIKGRYVGRQAF